MAKKKKNFATVVTDITKVLILRILSLSSSCYPVRAQRAHFLGDKLSTTPRHSTQNDARMALSLQKLWRPRYLPISPIVKWDPLRHHFSEKRHRSTAHCARTADTSEDLPDVISNPETRDSPTGAMPETWIFSRTWRHSGTFRDNFIGRSWGRTAVAKFASNPSSPLIFPVSCANGLFDSVPVISLFFINYTLHYVIEILDTTCDFSIFFMILSRNTWIFGKFDEINNKKLRVIICIE